ncbi:MAG: 50S ribosomal protein L1 [Gemmataceae bacterium]|nr:50S ribosomal protein L1 [Gemmataceae bacterium]MDW8264464.1 50S ribosomal protein L1 [Gemmataceae bacterium]
MAKKTSPPAEPAAAAAAAPPAETTTKETKKGRETKAKAGPAAETPSPPAAPPPAPAEAPGAAAAEPAKKKAKRPGISPPLGKKLRDQLKAQKQKIRKEGVVPLKKALSLLRSMKRAKFDETVEVHMSLGIDVTQSDQLVRGSVPLPYGIGKSVRVLVFCQGDNITKAKEAGADYAGGQDLVDKIQKENWLEFDVALATQDMMGLVSRLGKVLGPRGLMPTPKAGTVIPAGGDVAAAVREFKAGKVEYRADKGGNVHAGVGKLSFDDDKLQANITAFVEQIRAAKPAGVRGNYIKSITVSATMCPGIPVTV